jgi:hypothetical protein
MATVVCRAVLEYAGEINEKDSNRFSASYEKTDIAF